jgi:hypothetical protein
MKLKSIFSRIPKWLILLVILAAFYFIFRKSVEGFTDAPVPEAQSANKCICYNYYVKSGIGCNKITKKLKSTDLPPSKVGIFGHSSCIVGKGAFMNKPPCAC